MRDRLYHRDVHMAATRMWREFASNKAILIQRKLGENLYEYWAVPLY